MLRHEVAIRASVTKSNVTRRKEVQKIGLKGVKYYSSGPLLSLFFYLLLLLTLLLQLLNLK